MRIGQGGVSETADGEYEKKAKGSARARERITTCGKKHAFIKTQTTMYQKKSNKKDAAKVHAKCRVSAG
jgi:hypothetical protein